MSDIERLVEVKGIREGSGFLIAEGLILTAWHLLRPTLGEAAPKQVRVRLQRDVRPGDSVDGADRFATRLWPTEEDPGDDLDFALLALPISHRRYGDSSSFAQPVTWASLGKWGNVEVTAVGYPDVAIDQRLLRRDTKGITGWIQAADNTRSLTEGRGTLTIKLRDEDVPTVAPAVAWPAMSGAAVFAGNILVGVVRVAGEEGGRHQLRVLPVDRLFTRFDVANTLAKYNCSVPPRVELSKSRLTVLDASESGGHNQPAEDIFPDKFVFDFHRELSPKPAPIIPILQAYYEDLLEGKLRGFEFRSSHIDFRYSPQFVDIREHLKEVPHIGTRRYVEKLEKILVQALIITLNMTYLRDMQSLFCYQSCFWICRSIRAAVLVALRDAGFDLTSLGPFQDADEDPIILSDPLNYFGLNRCYKSEMIKLDIWDPREDGKSTSAYVPKSGMTGSWFSERPLPPQPLRDFNGPNDYYNFIFPQMLLRHLINDAPLIENWEGCYIGAA